MSQSYRPYVALVLQGGGALGAFQVGAYQALHEAGYAPDWVAGTSIGAFNAGIIVGNPLESRLDRLVEFWNTISRPDQFMNWLHDARPKLYNTYSYWESMTFGQPRFFKPRLANPYLSPPGTPGAVSYYDTSPMHDTFLQFSDYDLINRGDVRISLGATDIESGDLVFFSNHGNPRTVITPDHVIASGSLPPGFPPIAIDGRQYWDGACVSNTPLQAFFDDQPRGHSVVFVIDLWSAKGPAPQTIDDVTLRQKQIQFATRTARSIDAVAAKIDLRHSLGALQNSGTAVSDDAMSAGSQDNRVDIIHIIYHQPDDEVPNSDVEFSRLSIAGRRASGYNALQKALADKAWYTVEKPHYRGAVVHTLDAGTLTSRIGSTVLRTQAI